MELVAVVTLGGGPMSSCGRLLFDDDYIVTEVEALLMYEFLDSSPGKTWTLSLPLRGRHSRLST